MVKTVRKYLELTREEMAWYLNLSIQMIKSVEINRRQLSFTNIDAVMTIFKAIQDVRTNGPANEPPSAASYYTRQMKRTYRECNHALRRRKYELEQMQSTYARERFNLRVYELLVQSLQSAESKDDRARLKWAKRKIEDTLHRLKETDPAAQDFLVADIEGLKSKMAVLEGTALFKSIGAA